MKILLKIAFLLVYVTANVQAQVPEIPYESVPNFLRTTPDRNFGEVLGVTVNSQGHILVLNHPGNANYGPIWAGTTTELWEYDGNGNFLREVGKGVYGLAYAHQVVYDQDDNLWVVDKASNSIMQFDPEGYVVMNLGRREEGYHGDVVLPHPSEAVARGGYLGGPTAIGWDSEGNMYVSDGYVNSRVVKFDAHGNFLKDWGSYGSEPGQFNLPHALLIDNEDNIYVADRNNARIQVFDTDGNLKNIITIDVPYPADYQPVFDAINPDRRSGLALQPWAMCITDTVPQYIFVADPEPGRIYKMTTDGTVMGWLGSAGRQLGQFNWAHGLSCPTDEEIFVADMNNWRVQKLILGE
ncbi:MAG: 6-bladed beta-propeller [SAR86 cluster bacterium]|uniref:6-bladed beta-propeller n=1 Tax=SAR86 cluster bacterium TaxID=2030880 RepID=A0A2A5CCH7_9GAMM|nr:6-bladed beta-propeller [Gammaproteobacteria bacterium AH-315-E17]PCJ41076.1 MAG: 6-bladed beta-propeller [SAR86 cluster bacterium]